MRSEHRGAAHGFRIERDEITAARLVDHEKGSILMCLGVPGEILDVRREDDVLMGKVAFGGITKHVCLEHVPDAAVGDFVLVHVGFALSKIDRDEAARVFSLLEELDMLDEVNGP